MGGTGDLSCGIQYSSIYMYYIEGGRAVLLLYAADKLLLYILLYIHIYGVYTYYTKYHGIWHVPMIDSYHYQCHFLTHALFHVMYVLLFRYSIFHL